MPGLSRPSEELRGEEMPFLIAERIDEADEPARVCPMSS